MQSTHIKDDITSWLDNAGRFPRLKSEQTLAIAKEIQSLPEGSPKRRRLVNTLVNHNLRLVVAFVNAILIYSPGKRWGCPETVDYLQVGAIGLIRAAELYDPTKGYTFSTYANHWIRSKVNRYRLRNKSLVHISESMWRKVIFYHRNGYLKSKTTNKRRDNKTVLPMLREAVTAMHCTSLNVKDEYGREMINTIPSKSIEEGHDLYDNVQQALDSAGISALGKEILVASFMYDSSCPQIADRLNISVTKIRREKKIALRLAKASKQLAALV